MKRCLICYQPIETSDNHYHPACSQKWFGASVPPNLPYALAELNNLAKEVIKSHITVPGVQAKLSLYLDQTQKSQSRFTLVGLWGNYILKPPVSIYPQMPEIEDLTMHMAAILGIETVPHCLIHLKSGELAYLTKRIDRESDGRKIHMEDMCQLTQRLTEQKYRGSMEQVGKVILKYASNPLLDIIRFIEITLFSFLTGNADMHLKNFSLIHAPKGMVRLSPAYDLLSTRLLIPAEQDSEEMALTLNGKKSNLKKTDFESFSTALGLNTKQIENIWKRFLKGLPTIHEFLKHGIITDDIKQKYRNLITERSQILGI